MNKEEFLMTKFSEADDNDDIDFDALTKTSGDDMIKDQKEETDNVSDKNDDVRKDDDHKKDVDTKKEDDEKSSKDSDDKSQDDDEKQKLEDEAEESGISIDELKEKKEKESTDKLEKEIADEAERTGKTVDQIKTEREKSSADDDFNLFGDFKEENLDDKTSITATEFDFTSTLSEIGIDLDEGTNIKSKEEFVIKTKEAIENARQVLNLDEYPPEVKLIIDNYKKNNELSITDWYRNDIIRRADSILDMDNESKVKMSLNIEMKNQYSEEDLPEEIEDRIADMTSEEINKKVKDIDREIVKRRNVEYEKIIKEKNKWLESQDNLETKKIEFERKELRKKLDSMENYLGFPIPKNVKEIMNREIETGNFQKYLDVNVTETKLYAYLNAKLGSKIEKGLELLIAKEKNKAYKDGTDTIKKTKHNIRESGSGHDIRKRDSNKIGIEDSFFKED